MRFLPAVFLLAFATTNVHAQSDAANAESKSPTAKKDRAIIVTPKSQAGGGPPQDNIPIDSNAMKVIGPGSPAGSGGERSKSRY